MKKVISLLLSTVLVMAAVLSLSGCSSKQTVQDYIETEAFKTELSSIREDLKAQGISIEVTAKDNALLYSYTLENDLSEEELAAYQKTLEASAATLTATLQQVYEELKKEVDTSSEVTVTMEYQDADGTAIASFTYSE